MPATASEAFPNWYEVSQITSDELWLTTADLLSPPAVRDLARLVRIELGATDLINHNLGLEEVHNVGSTICADLERLARPWTLDGDPSIQLMGALLIATVSACVAFRAMHEGDIRTAREWVLRPIHRTGPDDGYDYVAPSRGSVFFRKEAAIPDGLIIPFVLDWAETLFVYERFRGPIGDAGSAVFEHLQPWLVSRLPNDPNLGHIAVAAAEWSCRREIDDDELQTVLLDLSRAGGLSPELEVALAVHLAETAERRGLNPALEAQHVLRDLAGRLTGTQMIRLTGLMAQGDPEAAVHSIKRISATIRMVMRDWRTTTSGLQTMGDRRGAHFKLVGTILEALLQAGRPDLVGDVLGAWLEVDPASTRRDLLYWFATESPGVGWAARQEIRLRADVPAVARYLEAFSQYTGASIGIADSDAFDFAAPTGRPGFPNADWDGEMNAAAVEVMAIPDLSKVISDASLPPQALVVIPYAGCPVQPLLIKHYGHAWPWSVSLSTPLPDRPIRRARVIVTGTDMGRIEGQGLQSILGLHGIDVQLIDDSGLGRTGFLDLYQDDWADLVWVIGHGEFDTESPESSRLLMPDGSSVAARALVAPPRTGSRRLLVLNVCEGGLAALTGGLPEIGLGAAAAGPGQAVIGHLWPILGWPDGPLFGRLLADGLTSGASFFEAYENAVRMLIAGAAVAIVAVDGQAGELDASLRRALEGRHGERMSELAVWGSAAFLE